MRGLSENTTPGHTRATEQHIAIPWAPQKQSFGVNLLLVWLGIKKLKAVGLGLYISGWCGQAFRGIKVPRTFRQWVFVLWAGTPAQIWYSCRCFLLDFGSHHELNLNWWNFKDRLPKEKRGFVCGKRKCSVREGNRKSGLYKWFRNRGRIRESLRGVGETVYSFQWEVRCEVTFPYLGLHCV